VQSVFRPLISALCHLFFGKVRTKAHSVWEESFA
jgi:hypothetical protein